jgi:hypothetical protein
MTLPPRGVMNPHPPRRSRGSVIYTPCAHAAENSDPPAMT